MSKWQLLYTHVRNCSGVDKIYGAMGDNLSILIQWVSTFLAAIVVGLVREYRLSLLLLAVVPIMVLSTYANGKVTHTGSRRGFISYSMSV